MNTDYGNQPPYMPTPAEIEAACRQIRRTWSENEHRKRAGFPIDEINQDRTAAWTAPLIRDPKSDL